MPRLPIPGSDGGQWGDVLNQFLLVEHEADGTLTRGSEFAAKYDKPAAGIPKSDMASAVQTQIATAAGAVASTGATLSGTLTYPQSGFLTTDGPHTWRITIDTSGNLVVTQIGGAGSGSPVGLLLLLTKP